MNTLQMLMNTTLCQRYSTPDGGGSAVAVAGAVAVAVATAQLFSSNNSTALQLNKCFQIVQSNYYNQIIIIKLLSIAALPCF